MRSRAGGDRFLELFNLVGEECCPKGSRHCKLFVWDDRGGTLDPTEECKRAAAKTDETREPRMVQIFDEIGTADKRNRQRTMVNEFSYN